MNNSELRQAIKDTLAELSRECQKDNVRQALEGHLKMLMMVEVARAASIELGGEIAGHQPHAESAPPTNPPRAR